MIIRSMVSVWQQGWQLVAGPGQDVALGGLGMANSKSGDNNQLNSGLVLEFLWWQ